MFSWLKRKEPENYEEVLAALAAEIGQRQARLADIRQRERRATFWLTVYAGAAWVAYVALWYARLVPHAASRAILERALAAAPVLAGPIVILFARRITQAWYTRSGNAEERTLKKLVAQQRAKVEDIKKKTNYYSMKNLLERYDDSPNTAAAKAQGQVPPGSPARVLSSVPQTPQRPGQPQPSAIQNSTPSVAQQPPLSPVQIPIVPPRRQWYDRLADAVLGEDEGSPSSKYALICAQCFSHNGLVKEVDWQRTKYSCPKCGFFNDAPGSKASTVAAAPRLRTSTGTNPGRSSFGPHRLQPIGSSPLSSAATVVDDEDDEEDEDEVDEEAVAQGVTTQMDIDS